MKVVDVIAVQGQTNINICLLQSCPAVRGNIYGDKWAGVHLAEHVGAIFVHTLGHTVMNGVHEWLRIAQRKGNLGTIAFMRAITVAENWIYLELNASLNSQDIGEATVVKDVGGLR